MQSIQKKRKIKRVVNNQQSCTERNIVINLSQLFVLYQTKLLKQTPHIFVQSISKGALNKILQQIYHNFLFCIELNCKNKQHIFFYTTQYFQCTILLVMLATQQIQYYNVIMFQVVRKICEHSFPFGKDHTKIITNKSLQKINRVQIYYFPQINQQRNRPKILSSRITQYINRYNTFSKNCKIRRNTQNIFQYCYQIKQHKQIIRVQYYFIKYVLI
eukprot:TRINITY_DN1612_c0_g1_i1.p1 TRINITY_DN1612_c0_g1~~TRINITY_DN1612_c0_g1_i1.p1  ORF type:complete len:216 (+),score=-18.74 TRINITY_DN1612_c0_g1_i1:436-1083(+)